MLLYDYKPEQLLLVLTTYNIHCYKSENRFNVLPSNTTTHSWFSLMQWNVECGIKKATSQDVMHSNQWVISYWSYFPLPSGLMLLRWLFKIHWMELDDERNKMKNSVQTTIRTSLRLHKSQINRQIWLVEVNLTSEWFIQSPSKVFRIFLKCSSCSTCTCEINGKALEGISTLCGLLKCNPTCTLKFFSFLLLSYQGEHVLQTNIWKKK